MYVTIWDMDYYYAKRKVNCFNPDVMKISSYHKQMGDVVNFVMTEDDIKRTYDICYIIKNKTAAQNPPMRFYLDKNVRWWGKAFKSRINGRMSDAMLGCRPDYLLYPERNTKLERSEHLRLFNNKAEPLEGKQDGSNTFKNKQVIITDPYIWCADYKNIINALDSVSGIKNLTFSEPIGIQKIMSNEELKNKFLALNLSRGAKLDGSVINLQQVDKAFEFLDEIRKYHSTIGIGKLKLDYRNKLISHGESKEEALKEFAAVREIIVEAKKRRIEVEIRMPTDRFETPYFELFEELAYGTKYNFTYSGLEYITEHFSNLGHTQLTQYGNKPKIWHEVFRDLLLQTYKYPDFILGRWGDAKVSENEVPGNLGEDEFKYEI